MEALMGREHLARQAVTAALRVRSDLRIALDVPVCPFDVAEALKIDVHLRAIPSLEGMYSPNGPHIVVGSMRPAGRRAFTCAHELGHHTLGHGLSVDELVENADASPKTDSEYAADRFAAALLMPKLAVMRAFATRGWSMQECTPEQAYVIAGFFGVGYTALAGYMAHTLHTFPGGTSDRLSRVRLGAIRKQMLGFEPSHGLLVVDDAWGERAVDLQIGDLLLVPRGSHADGAPLRMQGAVEDRILVRGMAPGKATVMVGSRVLAARVARPAFEGLAVYRHLEDADEDT
jgi:Zn-dependent peptidase ImmA (M78 family)